MIGKVDYLVYAFAFLNNEFDFNRTKTKEEILILPI